YKEHAKGHQRDSEAPRQNRASPERQQKVEGSGYAHEEHSVEHPHKNDGEGNVLTGEGAHHRVEERRVVACPVAAFGRDRRVTAGGQPVLLAG
ncbi:hypothetical protein QN416_24615, partial [Glaciimonas sp. Cout2]